MGEKTDNKVAPTTLPDENEHHGPRGSDVPFWKQPELRKLYALTLILFLGSTTLGYDGSLLNGLQTMKSWNECR